MTTTSRRVQLIPDHVHGTENGYGNYRCRCDACRKAHATEMLRQRVNRAARPAPEHVHGTVNGYDNYVCRCEACKDANRARARDRYARTQSAAARGSTRGKVCKWGHDLDGANLYMRKDGKKACKACVNERSKRCKAERRNQVIGPEWVEK